MPTLIPHATINRLMRGRHLMQVAFGGYKKKAALLVVFGFSSGLLEIIGINLLIPLFAVFDESARLPTDALSRLVFFLFDRLNIEIAIIPLLLLIVCMFLLKALALLLFEYVKVNIQAGYEYDMRRKIFRTILESNWSHLLKQKMGYLDNILRADIVKSAHFLMQLADLIFVAIGLLVFLLAAVSISQSITALTLVFGIFVFFIFYPLLYRARVVAGKTSAMNKKVSRHINESIVGIKALKTFSLEVATDHIGGAFFERLRLLQIKTFLLRRIPQVLVQPLAVFFIAGIVAFSYYQTSYNLGALATIIYLIQRIFGYIQALLKSANQLNSSIPYLQNMVEFERQARQFKENDTDTGDAPFVFEREFAFKGVSFAYDDRKPVLHNVSLVVPKGHTVGLVGSSGAGKTTIFDLILRLFKPYGGALMLDGMQVADISIENWRKHIAYVPQDMFMLGDTVYNNIRFFDETIMNEEIEQAAKDAHIYEAIADLPKGFNTHVGERAVLLSVGQRQRIAIARALARKPSILLLDEATSALDTQSEQAICETLEALKGKVTVIMIAHRRSTLDHADTIFVLKDGRIVEQGTPQELHTVVDSYFARMQ
ncbi:MAG: ABC transporter ATP-binding protein [bacterium]|nr:ABC transporter ATP-binding protein [bacterium]